MPVIVFVTRPRRLRSECDAGWLEGVRAGSTLAGEQGHPSSSFTRQEIRNPVIARQSAAIGSKRTGNRQLATGNRYGNRQPATGNRYGNRQPATVVPMTDD
jgi:hypothetical protein